MSGHCKEAGSGEGDCKRRCGCGVQWMMGLMSDFKPGGPGPSKRDDFKG